MTTSTAVSRSSISLTPNRLLDSWVCRTIYRLTALTRAEAALALPTALLFAGVGLLALVWIRLAGDVRAPIGSVEQETLLFGVLALVATPTMASMFDAARERSLSATLRSAPVTALECAAGRMIGAIAAIAVGVATVAALDALLALSTATPPESAHSIMLTRHGIRAGIEPFAFALPFVTFVVASVLQHSLPSAIVGAALATELLLPHQALPGAPAWLVFDVQNLAREYASPLFGALAGTLAAALIAPLRGRRSRSVLRRAGPAIAVAGIVLAARSPYGQRLALPAPSWSAEDAETRFFPSPDGKAVFIETYQKHAWPRRTLRRLDVETLEITRVPRPPVGILGWLTCDFGLQHWNAAGTAVVVDDLEPANDHAPPPLLALSPTGGWLLQASHYELSALWNDGSVRATWRAEIVSSEVLALRFTAEGGRALRHHVSTAIAFPRDLPHLLLFGVPGEELATFDGRTGEIRPLGVRLPEARPANVFQVSPCFRWAVIGAPPHVEIVHIETGWTMEVSRDPFSRTRRGTIAVLEADGWFEVSPDTRRPLPFPPETAPRHLFGDRWLVLGPGGASIRSTDGTIELDIPRPGPSWIEGHGLLD